MHELSIAHQIVETVKRYLPPQGKGPVKRIKLRIGKLNRITLDSLRFCFEAASQGTAVQGAKLDIEEIAGDAFQVVEFDLDRCLPRSAERSCETGNECSETLRGGSPKSRGREPAVRGLP